MPQKETVRVKGYKEFLAACDRSGPATKKAVREAFRATGEAVRKDAFHRVTTGAFTAREASRFVTASGYKTIVRRRGVSVEQTLRKTTGLHPEYGSWQMRHALIPALSDQDPFLEKELEHAMDEVADIFARGG